MKNSTTETVIQLTKIKQWYLPVDIESYKVLKDAGVPLLRIHEKFLPTLALITRPRNIRAKVVAFDEEIRNPFFDRLGEAWQKRPHRSCLLTKSTLKFETTHASVKAKALPQLEKIDASLRRFFSRWGFEHHLTLSESRGKLRLHVEFKFDSARSPIMPLSEDTTSLPTVQLRIGFVRLSLTLMQREMEINFSIAAGTDWTSIHTSRCLYDQVSDVRPMIRALMGVVDKDQHNFENLI